MMMNRRRFLSLTGGAVAAALLAACEFGEEKAKDPEVPSVTLAQNEIPPAGDEPLYVEEGSFFLINNEDGLLALHTKCTHQGCAVKWAGDDNEFHCPCHGSKYDRHGVDIEGPTDRPLELMKISVNSNGGIEVDTAAITKREEWSPDQSVQIG